MEKKIRMKIVLEGNQIVAAQLFDLEKSGNDSTPSVTVSSCRYQKICTCDVPRAIMELDGSQLHQFLSEVTVDGSEIILPEFKIENHRKK